MPGRLHTAGENFLTESELFPIEPAARRARAGHGNADDGTARGESRRLEEDQTRGEEWKSVLEHGTLAVKAGSLPEAIKGGKRRAREGRDLGAIQSGAWKAGSAPTPPGLPRW